MGRRDDELRGRRRLEQPNPLPDSGREQGGREVHRGQRETPPPPPEPGRIPAGSNQSFPRRSGGFLQAARAQAAARRRSSSPASTPACGSRLGRDPEPHSAGGPEARRLQCAAGSRPPGATTAAPSQSGGPGPPVPSLPPAARLARALQTFFLVPGGRAVPFRGGG